MWLIIWCIVTSSTCRACRFQAGPQKKHQWNCIDGWQPSSATCLARNDVKDYILNWLHKHHTRSARTESKKWWNDTVRNCQAQHTCCSAQTVGALRVTGSEFKGFFLNHYSNRSLGVLLKTKSMPLSSPLRRPQSVALVSTSAAGWSGHVHPSLFMS